MRMGVRMRRSSSPITHLLSNCQSMRELKQAQAHLAKTNLLSHPPLLSKLITLSSLSPFSDLHHSLSLFDSLSLSTTHPLPPSLYAVLIRAHSSSIFPLRSLLLYNRMCRLSLPVSRFAFPFVLKACAKVPAVDPDADPLPVLRKGLELHSRLFRLGLDRDVYVLNSLITMYSNCGRPAVARKVFDEMSDRTAVTWNAMAAGYDRNRDFGSGNEIRARMPAKNVSSWNSMITRHVRLGDIAAARDLFDTMPERDSISWNSMIAGYARFKKYECAIEMFKRMVGSRFRPTELTIVSVLGACAETGSMEIGREIHDYLRDNNFTVDGFVGNALLDMYAKSGDLKMARRVFDEMGWKHVTSWNSMIVALAVHGHCDESLKLFSKLDQEPNSVTFLGVLLACSHMGLVEEGREFFRRMVEDYKIEPNIKHYGCMVDMFSRTGMVDEAFKMIKEMPMKANSVIWTTFLGACKLCGDVELAETAFRELGEIGSLTDEDYVVMSNIYSEAERWEDAARLRCGTSGQSIWKQPGSSQIVLS
ncbi:putative pentatricopeptide repeat-containing protein [Iris pallida]|uniref:Pentatricopeptide repeat-containing protein n=1 Tax=Iris pallida TaxID=29817 RepID=A0AAX6GI41_IRIPA|nr:putative pentatricopeptide repeat-containing protein [Iris pallida]